MKPILFNTEMVQAILEGRKTCTRRIVKYKYDNTEMHMKTDKYGTRLIEIEQDIEGITFGKNEDGTTWHRIRPYIEPQPRYKKGDLLYVRETWLKADDGYHYKVDIKVPSESETLRKQYGYKWKPSIHMPKEAARIFLKVTNVRVERLNEMVDFRAEGIKTSEQCDICHAVNGICSADHADCDNEVETFADLWDSTVNKKELDKYGWNANPWVWVYEFERCEKPQE